MRATIRLLGGFTVTVDDKPADADGWRRRQAAALVKLLALAPGRRLHREQVLDALWPDVAPDDASPRLHKAAHYARRATGVADTVVLRDDLVILLPNHDVEVDAHRFEVDATEALRTGDAATLDAALTHYGGDLLPGDLYEPWAEEHRERLRLLHARLLRRAERWEDLLAVDPADEEAHVALMRSHARAGDARAALRQFERMDRALRRELGVGPPAEAVALRDELLAVGEQRARDAGDDDAATADLVGRRELVTRLDTALREAHDGRGRTVVIAGPPGVGKTALAAALRRRAAAGGWRVGAGVAAAVEGAWPYAPVLEAFADLARRHPTLLDGLDDALRAEIDRALAGEAPASAPATRSNRAVGHQKLFVAAAELLRVAAAATGVVLVVDDVHEADDATLRLLHYLGRTAATTRAALVLTRRVPRETPALDDMVDSLMRHGALEEVTVGPLDRDSCAELARRVRPDLDDDTIERIWAVSGGVPFTATELARSGAPPDAAMPQLLLAGLDRRAREVVQRVAVAGTTFDTDEFLALSGLDEDGAYECLDLAIAARVVERADAGYRFRHALVRDALLADLPPHRMRVVHREAARRLEGIGASPARVGFHLLRAGDRAAVPYLLQAAETDAALGAASDALELLDAARPHARGEHLARLLALRGDVLFTLGDVRAIGAYREAIDLAPEGDARRLRAKLGRAAVVAGDLATAGRALAGLEPDGGPDDAEILLARANHAYFTGDIDRAWEIAERAHALVAAGNVEWQLLDLVSLRGLIAHNRGEWFEQLRQELGRTRAEPRLATAMFDGQLCVAEYLLYGPVPYQEVIELARGLREAARRAGVLRAVAFAAALEGEAALLAGDLDAAERLLQEAVDLHHELGGHAGEAHSLQRLAELRLAQGRPDEARELLQRALPLARFSTIALHLLQRIHGTLVAAAPDPAQARAEVDHALATLGTDDHCPFCSVMFEVPATIACAAAGDLDAAARHLAAAEQSAARWQGRAWEAAVLEARAHVTAAGGRSDDAERLRAQAIETFARAGHHHDARRCREAQLPMPANADAAVASQ